MFENDSFSLAPVSFFQLSANCHYLQNGSKFPKLNKKSEKYLLPNTSALCGEHSFAQVFMGWNEESIELLVNIDQPYRECSYPEILRGDSVELMLDTRDVKTSGYNTRFCHHFFFLPEAIEGHQAAEITRFRTEDVHELCDSQDIKIKTQFNSKSYEMHILIPNQSLYGYDPDQFDRLGFTYRINRRGGNPQHFSVISEDFQIEQQPSLWASLTLVKS